MLDQEIRVYLNAQNYNYNNSSYKQLTRSVDITEIQAYSVLNGGFSGKPVSNSGKPFYESLIVLALMQQGNSLYATSDYLEAETSYCHCISFHLGMTAARLVFKKKFNLDLLHLKDPAIAVHTKSNYRPDFIALDNKNMRACVVEAKGTTKYKVRKSTIEHANTQVASVSSIYDIKNSNSSFPTESYIVTSAVDNKDSKWTVSLIDPAAENGNELGVDFDAAWYRHYKTALDTILYSRNLGESSGVLDASPDKYVTVSTPFGDFAVIKRILDYFEDHRSIEGSEGFSNLVNEVSDFPEMESETHNYNLFQYAPGLWYSPTQEFLGHFEQTKTDA